MKRWLISAAGVGGAFVAAMVIASCDSDDTLPAPSPIALTVAAAIPDESAAPPDTVVA